MKKLYSFVVAAMLCTSAAFAQSAIVSSSSSSITEAEGQTKSNTQWIVRASANFAKFTGDDAEGLDRKLCYDVALSFQKPLSDNGMFWGMELGLGSRGYSFEGEYQGAFKQNLLAHNIRFSPFTFGDVYEINESVKIDAHIGAWVSYDLFGKLAEESEGEKESTKISDIENYNKLDYGLLFGVGLWYNRFNVDLSAQRGFAKVVKGAKQNTSNIMLRFGFAF